MVFFKGVTHYRLSTVKGVDPNRRVLGKDKLGWVSFDKMKTEIWLDKSWLWIQEELEDRGYKGSKHLV